jgi:hypothetical protein
MQKMNSCVHEGLLLLKTGRKLIDRGKIKYTMAVVSEVHAASKESCFTLKNIVDMVSKIN